MSNVHCQKFPTCMNVGERAMVPKCDKADCPGRETFAPFFHAMMKDQCEHQWDGPMIDIQNGTSVTCSKCGADAYSHSIRNSW